MLVTPTSRSKSWKNYLWSINGTSKTQIGRIMPLLRILSLTCTPSMPSCPLGLEMQAAQGRLYQNKWDNLGTMQLSALKLFCQELKNCTNWGILIRAPIWYLIIFSLIAGRSRRAGGKVKMNTRTRKTAKRHKNGLWIYLGFCRTIPILH